PPTQAGHPHLRHAAVLRALRAVCRGIGDQSSLARRGGGDPRPGHEPLVLRAASQQSRNVPAHAPQNALQLARRHRRYSLSPLLSTLRIAMCKRRTRRLLHFAPVARVSRWFTRFGCLARRLLRRAHLRGPMPRIAWILFAVASAARADALFTDEMA